MGIPLMLAVLFTLSDLNLAQYCEKNNEEEWSYHGSINGPKEWREFYPECDSERASPIRLYTDRMENDRNLTKLIFIQYDVPIHRAEMVNDGRTVTLTPRDSIKRGVLVEGQEFTLQYLQFHFGSTDRPGAEHTINHIRYPMEVQFVHKNGANEFAAVSLLVDVSDHLQIVKHHSIGFYFLMTSVYAQMESNPAFDPILEVLPEVTFKGDSTKLRSPLHLNALLPENPASFYRYYGSLTTPPCDRAIWSVLRTTTCLGRHQLDLFLGLYSVRREDASPECLMGENYKPAENPREVLASQ
ncbi:carbonic anhydrase 12-like [Argiope bruennichi]|uniref:carbonic anhydrase n=1 Tax=Argiope bruennichi TaxID=94029 RepID=A0A8T0ESZ5_ARGBR|nr:carbonic anhydrase 12-like [Argiope bruennichi]XP_055945227.1 carbonic anhydrase 12-like [Argiope bruennichi]KAF8778568.1 Carbonic anhydrase 12 like protein [Argiope bruennichi]